MLPLLEMICSVAIVTIVTCMTMISAATTSSMNAIVRSVPLVNNIILHGSVHENRKEG